jgi:hypothetical protein
VLFDPSARVRRERQADTLTLGYVRSLDIGGNSGSIELVLPYAGIRALGRI